MLERPGDSVVVNMLAVSVADRPAAFSRFLSSIAELRARTGRPHWLLVDEAHHVLPVERDPSLTALPPMLPATIFVTVDPQALGRTALDHVDDIFAVGTRAAETMRAFCRALSIETPPLPSAAPHDGQALVWRRARREPPEIVTPHPPAKKSERHTRKYAEGELGEDKSFYFRGPSGALNLRAQNPLIFVQMAEGVDDETWMYHLKAHDYSRWMSQAIKDEDLSAEARRAEDLDDPIESRRRLRKRLNGAIRRRPVRQREHRPVKLIARRREGPELTASLRSPTLASILRKPTPLGDAR